MNFFSSSSGANGGTGAFFEKSRFAYAGSFACGPPGRTSGPPRPRPPRPAGGGAPGSAGGCATGPSGFLPAAPGGCVGTGHCADNTNVVTPTTAPAGAGTARRARDSCGCMVIGLLISYRAQD